MTVFVSAGSRAAAQAQEPPLPLPAATPPPVGDGALPGPITVPPPALPTPYIPFPHLAAPPPLDEARNGIGTAQQLARTRNLQGRLLWIDATANLDRVNTPEKIALLVDRIKNSGFNTIVFDIKPIVGYVMYPSKYAPKLATWTKNGVTRTLPAAFDPLAVFVGETRRQGMNLIVNLNVFSEGHRDFQIGPGYTRPEWQTVLYEEQARLRAGAVGTPTQPIAFRTNELPPAEDEIGVYTNRDRLLADLPKRKPETAIVTLLDASGRVAAQVSGTAFAGLNAALPTDGAALVGTGASAEFLRAQTQVGEILTLETTPNYVRIGERPRRQVPLMTNPHHTEVRQRLLDMIAEVVQKYAVDGVIFDDRLRYAGLDADFSPLARNAFEQYIGKTLTWPDDVIRYRYVFPTMERHEAPGPYYDAWLVFRALTLRNWLAEAVATVKRTRPAATVATYVGSWYPDYPDIGANWAADDLQAGFRFLSDAYRQTGWAGLVDFIVTGAYYPTAAIQEAAATGIPIGETVEAAGQFSNRAVNDQTWVYAGLSLSDYAGRPEDLKRALQAAAASTQGIMIFDLSHNIDPFWSVFEQVFKNRVPAPHATPGQLAELRAQRAARKASGIPDPPVVLYRGASGTGF